MSYAEAERAALADYDRAIAEQLIGARHDLADAAGRLLQTDELTARAVAVRDHQAEHQAELERKRVAEAIEEQLAELAALEAEARRVADEPVTAAARENHELRLRQARGRVLAFRLRQSGRDSIRIGRVPYDAREIAIAAENGGFDVARLEAFEAAMEGSA